MQYMLIAAVTVVAVVLMKIRYSRGPFKIWQEKAPKFVWFPKYLVSFEQPANEICQALESIGFKKSEANSNTYNRGKVYGDFSASKILLSVEVSDTSFKLWANTFILCDTGDLWKVSKQVLSSTNSNNTLNSDAASGAG